MGKNKLKIGEFSRLGCECPEPGYCYTIEHGGYKIADAPRAVYIDGIWNLKRHALAEMAARAYLCP